MEGCPKALMINFDLKEPGPIDNAFEKPLRDYIEEFYHEDPQSYTSEIQQITQLRKSIANVPRDKQGCTVLRKYYTQLHYLQSRFPMGEGGAVAIPFVWYDVYSCEPVVYKDIRYEQACVLFNLGGLYSQLASNEDRLTDESMRTACTHFQSAAGAFQFLKEHFSLNEMTDMNEDILSLKSSIMLGQALECIMEKSIRDDRNPTLIARIGIQVREYFQEGITHLNKPGTSEMGSTLRKLWIKHLKIKVLCYEAIAYTYLSNDADQKEKYGEKVAYLKSASEKINEAAKQLKNQSDKVVETVQFIMDVVSNKYDAAVKDNDFVYHMSVPALSALEEVKGVNFVKPLTFQHDDASVAGTDIFQKLVPMKAHESASLYSEVKANLLRKVSSDIEERDMQLSQYMSAMKIEDLLDPKEDSLPDELLAKNMFLQDNPDLISKVDKSIEDITMSTSEVESILAGIDEKLQLEKSYEDQDGLPADLKTLILEFDQLKDAHEKASKTNNELMKHSTESKGIMQFLSGDPKAILKTLPSQNVIDAPSDEPVVQRIREILNKVEKMRNQRQYLIGKLREELNKDDITTKIVVRDGGNNEEFFEEEMKKHDETVNYISQNLAAQENVLQALTEQNANYATTRQQASVISAKFDAQVKSYLTVVALYLEVKDRLSGGLKFYNQLNTNVQALQQKVNKYCSGKEKKRLPKTVAKGAPPTRPTAKKPNIMMNISSKHELQPQLPMSVSGNSQVYPNKLPGNQLPGNQLPGNPLHGNQLPGNLLHGNQLHGNQIPSNNQMPAVAPGHRFSSPQSSHMGQSPFNQQRFQQPLPRHAPPLTHERTLPYAAIRSGQQPVFPFSSNIDVSVQQPVSPGQRQHANQRLPGPMQASDGNHTLPKTPDGHENRVHSARVSGPGIFENKHVNMGGSPAQVNPVQPFSQSHIQNIQPQPHQQMFPTSQIPTNQQNRPGNMQFSPQHTPLHPRFPLQPPRQQTSQQMPPHSVHQLPPPPNQQRQQLPQQQMVPHHQQPMQPQQKIPQRSQQTQPLQQFPMQLPVQPVQRSPHQIQPHQQYPQQHQPPSNQLYGQHHVHSQQQISMHHQIRPPQQYLPSKMPTAQHSQPALSQPIPPWQQSPQQHAMHLQNRMPSQQQFNQHHQPISVPNQQHVNAVPINDHVNQREHNLPAPLMPERAGEMKEQSELDYQDLSPIYPRSSENSISNQSQIGQINSISVTNPVHHIPAQQTVPNMFTHHNPLPYQQSVPRNISNKDNTPDLITPREVRIDGLPARINITADGSFINKNISPSSIIPTAPNLHAASMPNQYNTLPLHAHQQQQPIRFQQTSQAGFPPQIQSADKFNQPINYQRLPSPYPGPSLSQPVSSIPTGMLFSAKPTMSPSSDPVISNILGRPVLPADKVQLPELAQLGFQQFQLQQYLLQQQQVITMLQNQQNLQRNEEDTKIHTLQSQIVEQQKLIEGLVKEHKGRLKEHNYQEFQQNLKKMKQSEYEKIKQEEQQTFILEQQQVIMNLLKASEHPTSPAQQGNTTFANTFGQLNEEKRILDKNIIVVNPLVHNNDEVSNTENKKKQKESEMKKNNATVPTSTSASVPLQPAPFGSSPPSTTTISINNTESVGTEKDGTDLKKPSPSSNNHDLVPISTTIGNHKDTILAHSLPDPAVSTSLIEYDITPIQKGNKAESLSKGLKGEVSSHQDPFYEPKIDTISTEELVQVFSTVNGEVQNKQVTETSSPECDLILPRNADEVDNVPQNENAAQSETEKCQEDIERILPRTVTSGDAPEVKQQVIPKVIDSIPHKDMVPNVENTSDDSTQNLVSAGSVNDQVINNESKNNTVISEDRNCQDNDVIQPRQIESSENDTQVESKPVEPKSDVNLKEQAAVSRDVQTTPKEDDAQDKQTQNNGSSSSNPPITNATSPSVPAHVSERKVSGGNPSPVIARKISSKVGRKISSRSSPVVGRKTSSRSSPNVSNLSSPNLSARCSPTPHSNSQSVQVEEFDNRDRTLSTLIDHRHLARQLGRLSFYVSEPDEIVWRGYINELDGAVNKLQEKCKNLCKPVENESENGFGKIWKNLAKVEMLDVRNFTSFEGESNISKNRYRDILPWDHTRVKLTSLPNDYINASLIENLTSLSPRYIATQGPIPQCFEDFWSMIWEQKTSVIVMLTNEIEGHTLKCHRYWRREVDNPVEYGDMVVILMDEIVSSAWKIRTFTLLNKKRLRKEDNTLFMYWLHQFVSKKMSHLPSFCIPTSSPVEETRVVKQLQFTSWPDYGTPESPYELLAFMEEVYDCYRKYDPSFAYPIVLHCSAGVGRTGSFCCIYSAIREIEGQNNLIEIPGVVRKLRQCRPHMVQRKEQLIFCYQAILSFAQQFVSTEKVKLDNSRRQSLQSGCSFDDDSLFASASSQQFLNMKRPYPPEKFTPRNTVSSNGEPSLPNLPEFSNYPSLGIVPCTPRSADQEEEAERSNFSFKDSDDSAGNAAMAPKFKINSGIFQSAKNTDAVHDTVVEK